MFWGKTCCTLANTVQTSLGKQAIIDQLPRCKPMYVKHVFAVLSVNLLFQKILICVYDILKSKLMRFHCRSKARHNQKSTKMVPYVFKGKDHIGAHMQVIEIAPHTVTSLFAGAWQMQAAVAETGK